MPAYASPSPEYVRLLTGVTKDVENSFEAELDEIIEDLLPSAEAWLEYLLTTATYESGSHTASFVLSMQDAVSFKTGERLFARLIGKVGEDAHHPIYVQPEQMTEQRVYCGREARRIVLALLGTESPGNNYLSRARLEPGA